MTKRRKDPHAITKIDDQGTIWCSCGTKCRDGGFTTLTAKDIHRIHAESQPK